jgi:hypothetical protein
MGVPPGGLGNALQVAECATVEKVNAKGKATGIRWNSRLFAYLQQRPPFFFLAMCFLTVGRAQNKKSPVQGLFMEHVRLSQGLKRSAYHRGQAALSK